MSATPWPRVCASCRQPLPSDMRSDAIYCSGACSTRAWRRRSHIAYPSDPLAQAAWEAERRLIADQAVAYLGELLVRIPEGRGDTSRLRRRLRAALEEIVSAFYPPIEDTAEGSD